MANLKFNEKQIFEKLFNRNGSVLDFSDRTFKEFFNDFNINIEDSKYYKNGPSKMNRLRTFWEIDTDKPVGEVINALLEYANNIGDIDDRGKQQAQSYINKLLDSNESAEDEFLRQEFSKIDLTLLNLEPQVTDMLSQRVDEIEKCLKSNANLSVIFLCGSTLEGILWGVAANHPKEFNVAKSAFKKDGKVQPFDKWTLSTLIDTAYEKEYIGLDVEKFSHALRDFRNFIHPSQQTMLKFNPNNYTAEISWKVLQAAIDNLCNKR